MSCATLFLSLRASIRASRGFLKGETLDGLVGRCRVQALDASGLSIEEEDTEVGSDEVL